MNWEAISAVRELVGVTAVMITFIYLAVSESAEHSRSCDVHLRKCHDWVQRHQYRRCKRSGTCLLDRTLDRVEHRGRGAVSISCSVATQINGGNY